MTPAEARGVEAAWKRTRALEMARQLYDLLSELCDLPENGEGSHVERAWDHIDEVIGYLEPEKPEPLRVRAVGGQEARS